MGLARIVEIDTTGGPGFGFEHFKQYDFLRDKEVVLTFDDGPWPGNTPAVLKALTDECLKATFFEIGEHATWHPEITKQVIAAGIRSAPTPGRTRIWRATRTPRTSSRPSRKSRWASARCMWPSAAEDRAVLPLPGPAASAGAAVATSPSATSRCSRPTSTRSTSRCTSPKQVIKSVMSQLREARQGHHPDARLPARTPPRRCRNSSVSSRPAATRWCTWCRRAPVTTVPKYDEMLDAPGQAVGRTTRGPRAVSSARSASMSAARRRRRSAALSGNDLQRVNRSAA